MNQNVPGQEPLKGLVDKADNLRNNGRETEAIEAYKEALEKYSQMGEIAKSAECAHMIGVCYKILKNEEDAFRWYDQAIENYKKVSDLVGVGNVQRDVGIMHEYYNRHEQALEFLQRSKETLQGTSDRNALGMTLAKIGMIQTKTGDYTDAESNLKNGLAMIRDSKDRSWFMELTTLLHFGELEFIKGQVDVAIVLFRQALGIIYEEDQQHVQQRRLGQVHASLAWCYLKKGDATSATKQLERAMEAWKDMDSEAQTVVFGEARVEKFITELKKLDPALANEAQEVYGDAI